MGSKPKEKKASCSLNQLFKTKPKRSIDSILGESLKPPTIMATVDKTNARETATERPNPRVIVIVRNLSDKQRLIHSQFLMFQTTTRRRIA